MKENIYIKQNESIFEEELTMFTVDSRSPKIIPYPKENNSYYIKDFDGGFVEIDHP